VIDVLGTNTPKFTGKGNPTCAEVDPEIFFPERGAVTNGALSIKAAKSLCQTCPYTFECLEWALSHSEMGIWGGTTERERRRLKRSRSST